MAAALTGAQAFAAGSKGDRQLGAREVPAAEEVSPGREEALPPPGFLTCSFWDWHKVRRTLTFRPRPHTAIPVLPRSINEVQRSLSCSGVHVPA